MSTEQIILIANSNTLELNGLRNQVMGGFINTATVVASLKDSAGVDVAGQSWPVILNYVSGTDGNYRALFEPTLELIPFRCYTLDLVAQGDGLTASWSVLIQAQNRH